MNARCRPWRIAAMGLMMLGQSLVWAKGPVSNIIYDPTNHAKNLLSAEQSGQQVLEMIKAAMTLVTRWMNSGAVEHRRSLRFCLAAGRSQQRRLLGECRNFSGFILTSSV